MVIKKHLTNEELSKQFDDNFQLAIQAMRIAKRNIQAGHEVSLTDLLNQLRSNPDAQSIIDSIVDVPREEER